MPGKSITHRPTSVDDIPKGFNDWWRGFAGGAPSHVRFSKPSHSSGLLQMHSRVGDNVRVQWSNGELSCERAGRTLHLLLDNFDVKADLKGHILLFEFKMSEDAGLSLKAKLSAVERSEYPIFVSRGLSALTGLVEDLPKDRIDEASAASTDYMVLVEALSAPSLAARLTSADPLAGAKLRGAERQKDLVEKSGGVLTSERVAQILGISRQAVDKRRRQGRLIGLVRGRRGYAYPAWQFKDGSALPNLETVLERLENHDPWMQLAFFVNGNDRLKGSSPLDELRSGRLEPVLEAAATYGEQGAA